MLEEVRNRVNNLIKILQALSNVFNKKIQFVFLLDFYNAKTNEYHGLARFTNYSKQFFINKHIEYMTDARERLEEFDRFKPYLNLPEFKVVCINVEEHSNLLNATEHPFDWVELNAEYLVRPLEIRYANNQLCFNVIDVRTGEYLTPPEPLDGFGSKRFEPIDYTKLN